MAVSVIKNFIAKQLFKQKGAISNNKAVEFSANALENRLKNLGVDPNAIRSEKELNQILAYVKQSEDAAFQQGINTMLGGSKFDRKGEVFDMTGKKIKDPKNIMGGTEINEQTLKEGLMKTDNPFSDLVNTPRPKTLKEREAEVLARMEKDNKEAVERIRERKRLENLEDPEDMATGGRAGFKAGLGKRFLDLLKGKPKQKFDVEKFREGPIDLKFLENIDKKDLAPFIRSRDKGGIGGYGMYDDFADMPAGLKAAELINNIKTKDGGINYKAAELFLGKKLKGNESADELIQILNRQEMRADGGRIGYANGTPSFEDYLKERGMIEKRKQLEQLMREYQDDLNRKKVMQQKQEAKDGGRIGLKTGMTKRAFLKLMGSVGAGIGALKTGVLGFGKGAATKEVAKEVVEQGVRSTPPPYFFELANKIKTLGKPDKVTYADRVEIHRYTGKNGDEFELIEDLNTGDMRIQKDKMGGANFGDESYEVIDDRTVLEYRKGELGVKDEGLETQSTFRSADEYEEYKVEFDQDGTEAGVDEITANVQKEIIEEASGEAPSIKKASGGIARMLGE